MHVFKKRYRIQIHTNIIGEKWYIVESKSWIFGKWYYEDHTLQGTLKEVTAAKILLENGQTMYSIFKPSARCVRYGFLSQ